MLISFSYPPTNQAKVLSSSSTSTSRPEWPGQFLHSIHASICISLSSVQGQMNEESAAIPWDWLNFLPFLCVYIALQCTMSLPWNTSKYNNRALSMYFCQKMTNVHQGPAAQGPPKFFFKDDDAKRVSSVYCGVPMYTLVLVSVTIRSNSDSRYSLPRLTYWLLAVLT